ncbi:MAG: 4'-phosphopantetheinyl transferase superfamily protein [Pirellulaceae bacterium]|nr:4'-phosphopantetheinyl transferase superfamily protein [Pirellulaceae bacterium]
MNVWHATTSTDQPGRIESCCEAWLDCDEVARADRFRRPTSRNQHVVGRGMARRLLGYESVAPTEIRFAEEIHGKPYVVEPEAAKQPFNVAHTEGLVMCGVGDPHHELVGVDVERLGRRTDPALAERYFSRPEVQYLNTKTDEQSRRDAFLRVWTLKESYIKAIGTGLQTPLADFAFVDIDSDQPQIEMLNPKLESDLAWQFFSIRPRPGFIGAIAVACRRSDAPVEINLQCFDDLIESPTSV